MGNSKIILLKDIVIPAGTVFEDCSGHTISYGGGMVRSIIGLTKDSSGDLIYGFEHSDLELREWFGEFTTSYVLAANFASYQLFMRKHHYRKEEYVFIDSPEKLRGANRNSPLYLLPGWLQNPEYKQHAMRVIVDKFNFVKDLAEE